MPLIRWFAHRRFNHIDTLGIVLGTANAVSGRWLLAFAAYVVLSLLSVVCEYAADEGKR